MSGIDPYKVLGVGPEASYEEVRQAYRRAATKYHPDAGGDAWVFQQVQQAYAILREKFESVDAPKPGSFAERSTKQSISHPQQPIRHPQQRKSQIVASIRYTLAKPTL